MCEQNPAERPDDFNGFRDSCTRLAQRLVRLDRQRTEDADWHIASCRMVRLSKDGTEPERVQLGAELVETFFIWSRIRVRVS